jgi:nonsense-mediated mRNA decay protein 3
LKDHPSLIKIPSKLELEKCKRCDKVRLNGRWLEWSDEAVHKWIIDHINVKALDLPTVEIEMRPHPKEEKEFRLKIMVKGEVEDSPVEVTLYSTLFIRSNICNDDMLITSDYYEGIVQVRFSEKTPEKVRAIQDEIVSALTPLQKLDSKAVVVNWVGQDFGIDAWIVSKKGAKAAAVAVSRAHGGTMSVSGKLIGLDVHTSKTKNRLTFLVRIP